MLSSPHSNSPYRGKGMPPFTYSKHWNNVKEILEQSTGGIGMKNEGLFCHIDAQLRQYDILISLAHNLYYRGCKPQAKAEATKR